MRFLAHFVREPVLISQWTATVQLEIVPVAQVVRERENFRSNAAIVRVSEFGFYIVRRNRTS